MRLFLLAAAVLPLIATAPANAADVVDADVIVKSLRGVKHMSATPAAATPATPVPADAPAVSLLVLFDSGSADLSGAGRAQLDQLGSALKNPALAGAHFRIEGHTDTVGDDQTNLALSERRAKAVVDYLVAKFAVEAARLVAVGKGKQDLAVKTPDQTPEAANRRVVVINLDG